MKKVSPLWRGRIENLSYSRSYGISFFGRTIGKV
jgi:hypothetical protein